MGDYAKDAAAWAVKGAIGVPEAIVGLADIPTGGAVGKALENEGGAFGFRPKQAKEIVNDWHSDATKQAQQKFEQAEGIGGKFQAAIQNPSNIVGAVAESLPAMGAGGVAARGLLGATRLGQMGAKGAALAGAAGEGIMGAGSAAEQIRQETPDGLLTPMQSAAGVATGLTTAAFGALGGKAANRLGIGDADTMIAQGAKGAAAAAPQAAAKSIPRSVIEGAISEGLLEELPQSVSEQGIQNLALGKEWSEGVDAAAVMGALSGGAMGGAAAGYKSFTQPRVEPGATAAPAATAPAGQQPQAGPTLALPGPDQGVIAVGADGTARTPAYQAPGYVGDVTDVEAKAIDPVREQVATAAAQGGALSAAALTAMDTGLTDAMQPPMVEQAEPAPISLEEADARDQAAYDQHWESYDADPVVARYYENDDDIPDFDAASNVSDEEFLRSLGATDEDIQDAIATSRQSTVSQGGAAVNAGTQANEPASPSQGAAGNEAGQASQVAAGLPQPGNFTGTPGATMGTAGQTARPGPGFGLKDALAQIRAKKQQEATNAQATEAPAPAATPAPGPAAAPAVEAAGVAAPNIKAITAKLIPDMTDDELQVAIAHYGPDHKRTPKLQKEVQRRAGTISKPPGATSEPQAPQAIEASPQPAQAGAAPAASPAIEGSTQQAPAGTPEVRALSNGAQAQDTGAQAAPAPSAPEAAPAAPEFTTVKTVDGGSVTVRTAELNSDKAKLRQYTKAGKAKAVPAIHRDNLDPAGEKRAAVATEDAANPLFNVITTKSGKPFAIQSAAERELNRRAMGATHEVVRADAVQAGGRGFVIRRKEEARQPEDMQPFAADTGTLGIPRAEMPQIPAQSHGGLVKHLNAQGIEHETTMVEAADLKPTQAEYSPAKVEAAKQSTGDRAVIVSNDGHIIDGHHQALAAAEEGEQVKAIVLDVPVEQALEAVKNSPSAQPAPASTSAPIQDAGEKIGGARKDRWKERGLNLDDLDAMTESEGAELATKANVWKPDYEAMSEASEPVTAAMVKIIYDQLAAKPKKNTPEGRRQYVQMMRIVRDVLIEAKGPEAVKNAFQEIRKRAGLNTMDPVAKAAGRELLFSVYKGRSDPFVFGFNELQRAKKLVADGFPAKAAPWKARLVVGREEGGPGTTKRGVEIYMARSAEVGTPLTREQILDGFYRVVTKDNKAVAFAASKADAEAAAATVYERDMKGKKDGKPEPVRPNLDELKRENLPRRIDRDVSADDFVKDLGFRGIEFGNWSAQDERQRILNMAYDGLMDLAEIMGVPPKAMSLNGTLGMAFGARGGGRFAAHYEPGKLVINMTKIRGGGSMAHEWAHAMDHYFGELDKPDAYTTQARGASGWYSEDQYLGVPRKRMERVGNEWKNVEKMRLDNLRPEMAAAFDGVMRALFSKQVTKAEMVRSHELDLERTEALARNEQVADLKAMYQNMVQNKRQALNEMRGDPEGTMYAGRGRSEYASQAQKLSGKSTDGYWVRPTEMFARAFESWVFDRVTAMGAKSDYLVHGVEEDRFAGGAYKGNPYPTGEERARINAAFDKLAGTIKTKETDKGVAMFSRSPSTKSAYETRIDALFAGDPASRVGVKVLDRSDVLGLLGYPDQPVVLAEGKVRQGQDNHQRMTAEVWKKIPEWLDNPAAAFDSDTVPGRLVLIAPEMVNGAPVRMILEPNTAVGGMQVHLLVNAFDAAGRTPWTRWAADGLTRYIDKKKFPEILTPSGLQLSRVEQASRGTAKILTEKQLAGYRRANSSEFARASQAGLSPEQAVAALSAENADATADQRDTQRRQSDEGLVATQMLVDGLTAKWTRAPEIIVARNMQDGKIPQRVRDYDEQLKSQGSDGEARGFIYQGKVYLLSDVLKGPEQIAEVLFHEALGHYGLRGVFGDGLKPILQQMGTMRRKDVLDKAREYGMVSKGMNDVATWAAMSERDRLSAAEEVLAEMAQSQPTIGFVQRAVAAVRTWLRANVPGLKDLALTDAEIIRSYILPARGYVTRSKETREQSLQRAMMAFSRDVGESAQNTALLSGMNRKSIQARAKQLGLPATGTTGEISRLVSIAEADPRTWSKDDFDAIKHYLSVHQDFGANAEAAEARIMSGGLDRGMVDNLGAMDTNGSRTFAKGLTEKRAYVFVTGALKYQPGAGARLAPGNVPLFSVTPQPGKTIFETIKATARNQNISGAKSATELTAFNSWFAGSKVVDANGKPIVMFHGTTQTFDAFDLKFASSGMYGSGFYFTDEFSLARDYAAGGPVMEVYLSLKNPATQSVVDEVIEQVGEDNADDIRAELIRLGHDGVLVDDAGELLAVAFEPSQVKSAVSNNGDFNPADNRINFDRASEKDASAFSRWFAGSKILDAEGKPLTVYHGTQNAPEGIEAFGASQGFAGQKTAGAIWFTSDAAEASGYANWVQGRGNPTVYPVHLSIKNPASLRDYYSAADATGVDGDPEIGLYEPRVIAELKKRGFDGVRWTAAEYAEDASAGQGQTIVAFKPEQAKSAIGNNGNFDPEDGRINFSRASMSSLKASAMDQIHKTLTHPGKVSMWDKTVGTMRHLGERAPAFKPVFDAAQRFIDDVSTLANEVADAAPRLLPRVETLADLKKKPISAEDNKAIARPLFEGTLLWGRDGNGKPVLVDDLEQKYANMPADDKAQMMLRAGRLDAGVLKMWRGLPLDQYESAINTRFQSTILKPGVVWSEQELKSLFNATPQQISLYQEARAAIDRSIDVTARADMLRVLGAEYAPMRDAVMETPSMTDALNLLVETLEQEAKADPDQRDRLAGQMHQLRTRHDKARELMAEGYAPLSRFGRYTVDVVDAAGERQYFGMFETAREANVMALKMRDQYKDAAVTQGTMSQEAYKLFAGITPESLELFGNMLGLDAEGDDARDKAFQEYLKLAKNNHSALKRLIHRKGIAGYSEDVGRVLASFVYSNARQAAGGLNAGTMETAINNIPKEQGELKDVALGLQGYIRDPQEEGQAIRGMLFAQYLGGSVASAFVNMTQPFAVTMPYLSQFGGMRKASAQMARAVKDVGNKDFKGEPDLARALHQAVEDGTVAPQEIHQLMAQARGAGGLRTGDGTRVGDARAAASNTWERVKVAWGQPFALAEQFNRRSTFIAAFRIAKAQGNQNPAEFARKAVLETQFLYSKANKARWARGAVGGTLMTFKTYSVSYLELLQRTWNAGTPGSPERAAGRRAVAWSMAMLMLMGGAGGLPFAEDLEDLIDGIGQLMGYNVSAKQWRKEAMRGVLGKELAGFVESGVSGLPGAPIDVSGRLGMGNLIPGTGLLLTKQNRDRDLLEVVGPAGDLVSRGFTGARKLLTGDVGGAALEVSPSAVRNAAKGIDMATSGIYKDTKGYKVIDTTLPEAASKFIGFQPRSVADVQQANSFMQRSKSFYVQTSSEIKAQWAAALFSKDEAALQDVRDRLDAWNRNNPDQRINVNMPDVWKRVREMGKDRTERIADTAPKALREQMRQAAKDQQG
ncbi:PLxRFG domain-containing protein [Acidovorax sp. BL-A-41-H1]|uniref:PLxRFG domain-containing protein n=1 Tax=Acidovorax sp. BL-A-41-H1 TaxID=3421102 RepID=UPI003F7AA6AD